MRFFQFKTKIVPSVSVCLWQQIWDSSAFKHRRWRGGWRKSPNPSFSFCCFTVHRKIWVGNEQGEGNVRAEFWAPTNSCLAEDPPKLPEDFLEDFVLPWHYFHHLPHKSIPISLWNVAQDEMGFRIFGKRTSLTLFATGTQHLINLG